MNRWWLEQQRRFWWKESRESIVFIGLAWVVIIFLMIGLGIPKSGESFSRYLWGSEFHSGATAILLFIAICLGVTAYAVEEESETITPLLAKPIRLNDIFATKLGVRLGWLFASMLLLGLIEIWTGAWPIEWRIPSPVMFERWLSGVMLCVMGLGLGLYFGKTLGRQTSALVASGMVFLAGFIYLTMSPLGFLFEGPEGVDGKDYYWIRDILLPGLTGTIAIIAALYAPLGEPGFMARRKTIVGTLAITLYALILWSFTIVPPDKQWYRPEVYRQHLVARTGSPEAGIDVLIDRYLEFVNPDIADQPELVAEGMIKEVSIRNARTGYDYEFYGGIYGSMGNSLLGLPLLQYGPSIQRVKLVNTSSDLERIVSEHRNPDWFSRCLELAQDRSRTILQRLTAIHLVGVINNPDHTETLASLLTDPSDQVQFMAALMLYGREDPRGIERIQAILSDGEHEELMIHFATRTWPWRLDLGEAFGDLMRDLAVSEQYNGYRRAGRGWLQKYGTVADADLVRRSLWLGQRNNYRDPWEPERTPDDIEILLYLKSWGAENYLDQLWQHASAAVAEVEAILSVIEEIPERDRSSRTRRNRLTDADRWALSRWNTSRRESADYLLQLIREGESDAVAVWRHLRSVLSRDQFNYVYRYYGDYILAELPALGEYGFQVLQEVATDRREPIRFRFQANLMLAYYGYEEYHERVFQMLEIYKLHKDFYYGSTIRRAAEIMVARGHQRYVEIVIDYWWNEFQNDRVGFDAFGGTSFGTIAHLEELTGKNYGWDVRAWKKWWDREGMHIAAAGNNN